LAGKAGVFAVAALAVVVVLWVIAFIVTEKRLAKAEARCAVLGMSRSWEERVGPAIADEENAAVALEEAIEYAQKRFQKRFFKANAASAPGQMGSSNEIYRELAGELIDDAIYDRLLQEADARQSYRSRMGYVAEPNWSVPNASSMSRMMYVTRVEPLIAGRQAAMGLRKEAVERLLRVLRISRKRLAYEPSLGISGNELNARVLALDALNGVLRGGRLPKECYETIDAEVRLSEDMRKEMVRPIDAHRYFQINGNQRSSWGRNLILRPIANLDRMYVHEAAANYVDLIGVPYAEAVGRLTPPHPLENPLVSRYQLSMFYAYEQLVGLRRAADVVVARARCLRIVNAMAKRDDFGAAIEALGLPAESLIDPFDGKRLRVRETKHGPVVYSIGHDLVDDGGQPQASNGKGDISMGPFETPEVK